MDFWQDPTFQFAVTIAIAIAAVVISIMVYLKQRQKKDLSYTFTSTPLLSIKDEIKKKIQILYDGKSVEQVHLVVVKIINSGNSPIAPEDFKTPVTLNFGKDSEILSGEITETDPENLEPNMHAKGEIATLAPLLLNNGDSVKLNMLVKEYKHMSIGGRIIGVKEIRPFIKSSRKYVALCLFGLSWMILTLSAGLIFGFDYINLVSFITGSALFSYGWYKW